MKIRNISYLSIDKPTYRHMTIRDNIATQFMTAILSSDRFEDYKDEDDIMEAIAKDAYKMADKMMKAKNEKGE